MMECAQLGLVVDTTRTRIRPHVICFSEVTLGNPSDNTPEQDLSDTMLRGLLR